MVLDVLSCRVTFRVTTNIDLPFTLVDPDPVDFHDGREDELIEINSTKLFGHSKLAKVHQDSSQHAASVLCEG